jgi:hypothetical protein
MLFAKRLIQVVTVLCGLCLTACQSSNGYLMNGIGAELPARDIESATRLQQIYFDHLCIQAGLGDGGCNLQPFDRSGWTLVVQQGMNDIDRRCDAYLEWLDNQRRSKAPLLSQIGAVQNTTTAIIGLVHPASGAAISVVGQAFGLLTKSVENYQSRLLLVVEGSTVNSVVLRARSDFRGAFSGRSVESKPEAEFVLREYLRRCLPFAIETQINDLSTLGARGIKPDSENSIFQPPVTKFITGTVAARADESVIKVKRPRIVAPDAGEVFGPSADKPIATSLQRAMCVVPADGVIGPQTKFAIAEFERIHNDQADKAGKIDGKLDPEEQNSLQALGDCPAQYQNAAERLLLGDETSMGVLRNLITKRYAGAPANGSLADLRPFIEQWRQELKLSGGPGNLLKGQVTSEFLNRINFFG